MPCTERWTRRANGGLTLTVVRGTEERQVEVELAGASA